MCETVRLEIRCDRIDPGDDGMPRRSILVVPMIVTEIFGGFLMMGPVEAATHVQEVFTEAVRLAPNLGTASRLYMVTPDTDGWFLQRFELDPDFQLYPVSWDSVTPDIAAAFRAADALRRGDARGAIA
jgi:hypothetical protein